MKCLWVPYSFLRRSAVEWLMKTRNQEDAMLFDRCVQGWESVKRWMGILQDRAASAKPAGRDFKSGRNRDVKTTRSLLRANAAVGITFLVLVLTLAIAGAPSCYAQGQAQPPAKMESADVGATEQPSPDKPAHAADKAASGTASQPASPSAGEEISPQSPKNLKS